MTIVGSEITEMVELVLQLLWAVTTTAFTWQLAQVGFWSKQSFHSCTFCRRSEDLFAGSFVPFTSIVGLPAYSKHTYM